MLGYSVFRFFALLGRVFHQIRPNAIVAIVRAEVVAQTAVRVDTARIVRVAGVRGNRSFPKYHYTLSGIGSDGAIASAVSCSALYHFAVMNLTSRVNFVQ